MLLGWYVLRWWVGRVVGWNVCGVVWWCGGRVLCEW